MTDDQIKHRAAALLREHTNPELIQGFGVKDDEVVVLTMVPDSANHHGLMIQTITGSIPVILLDKLVR